MYTFAVKPDVLLTGNECNVGTNVPLLTGSFFEEICSFIFKLPHSCSFTSRPDVEIICLKTYILREISKGFSSNCAACSCI